ncbi:MAG: hypothetical protein ACRDBQ_12020 [Shewanella sp.]
MSQSEQLKRHLCQHLKLIIKMNGWCAVEAADKMSVSVDVIYNILKHGGSNVNIKCLIDCLDRAGMDIKITITPR